MSGLSVGHSAPSSGQKHNLNYFSSFELQQVLSLRGKLQELGAESSDLPRTLSLVPFPKKASLPVSHWMCPAAKSPQTVPNPAAQTPSGAPEDEEGLDVEEDLHHFHFSLLSLEVLEQTSE